nr:nucleic acid-binding, OB-fold protein [Tanacetum cinerariifolium]
MFAFMRTKRKLAFESTEVANSQDICGDGCGIHLQHDLQSFVVPNVSPNVTAGNVGSTVSPVNVATLDVAGKWADVRNAILTDYIGRIQAVSGIHTSGDVTTNRTRWRIIDIQNLSGNTISLALWHEMAMNFNVREYEPMEKPVVIAVSSYWVRHNAVCELWETSHSMGSVPYVQKPWTTANDSDSSRTTTGATIKTSVLLYRPLPDSKIIEGNIDESHEPQSTPPQTQQPTDKQKEGEPPKLPHSFVRKVLFHTDPQAESSHVAKRTKH